jgi:hypothetical protein
VKTYCEANCGSNHMFTKCSVIRGPPSASAYFLLPNGKCASFAALFIELHCLLHCISYSIMHGNFVPLKPGAHTAILVGRFRFRWMFSAKTISDRICGLIYIATFANIIHLNLNRPTKIAVCAPGLRRRFGTV